MSGSPQVPENPWLELNTLQAEIKAYMDEIVRGDGIEGLSREDLLACHASARAYYQEYTEEFEELSETYLIIYDREEQETSRKFCLKLRQFERRIHYAVEEKEYWSIPEAIEREVHVVPPGITRLDQGYTTGRLIWLLQKMHLEEELYPEGLRFKQGELIIDSEDQLPLLPDKYRWMADWLREPTLEWMAVFYYVSELTWREATCDFWLKSHLTYLIEHGVVVPGVEQFTTEATLRAVQSGVTNCPICDLPFTDTDSPDVEPAVETNCHHFMGKDCLQEWMDSGQANCTTCPMCRSPLLGDTSFAFPQHIQQAIGDLFAVFKDIRSLDPQIDQFLLDGSEENLDGCYGLEVCQMLENLQHAAGVLQEKWITVYRLVSEAAQDNN